MSGLVDSTMRILGKALDGLAESESAIASNLANIDTPNYQPKSIDFETALKSEVAAIYNNSPANQTAPFGAPAADVAMRTSDPRHFASIASPTTGDSATTSTVNENLRNDSNTVDLETEMTALTQDQIKFEANSRLIAGKLAQLSSVLGGR